MSRKNNSDKIVIFPAVGVKTKEQAWRKGDHGGNGDTTKGSKLRLMNMRGCSQIIVRTSGIRQHLSAHCLGGVGYQGASFADMR